MNNLDNIVSLAKRRGFIYPGSQIYGGLANTYDYGPVGTELLRNIKELWWKEFVHKRHDIIGIDSSIISHQNVWKTSGHTSSFSDSLIDCKSCKIRLRADHLIEDSIDRKVEGLDLVDLEKIITDNKIKCPKCGESNWTKPRNFNLLFPVHLGIVEGDQDLAYLRGETAQGIFINFDNIINSTRVRLPFGIGQCGKSFRNEITPGNSVFRTLEFEQGEIEYFFDPEVNNWETLFEEWKNSIWEFVVNKLGVSQDMLRWREHTEKERSFYSKRTVDLEYKFPFGYKELWGLAYRTDYDLSSHEKGSGNSLRIMDPILNKKILPHVIEPAVGINRIFLMLLCEGYVQDEKRTILRFKNTLAPYKAAVFPLLANKQDLLDKSEEIYKNLSNKHYVAYDSRGNIGKRYLSQDEIGTPFCITVDFQTLEDETVTVRNRDDASQVRIKVSKLLEYIDQSL